MSENQKPMFVTFLATLCLFLPSIMFRQMFWLPLLLTVPYFVWIGLPVINKSIEKQTIKHFTITCLLWVAVDLMLTSTDLLTEVFGSWNRFIIPLGPVVTPVLVSIAAIAVFDFVYLKLK